jgi:DNA-binding SARP family transcriptional activator/Flp pilus assembly protein TadD
MEFRLLGRVVAEHDGRLVELGRRRERCLLGVLLLEVGTPVPVERLLDLLWDDEAPDTARPSLHAHVSRLRRQLDPGSVGAWGVRLLSRQGGYLVDVDPQAVDVHRFRSLVDRANAVAVPAERSALLREALGLWRGPLLADVASDRLRSRIGADLTERRLSAIELAVDADLAAGRHTDLIGELVALTGEHPLRERFTAQLMLALYRSGRQSEALDAYERLRARLADELGIDPGPEAQRRYTDVLRQDPGLRPPAPAGPPAARPAQLPPPVGHFTGRADSIKELDTLLDTDIQVPTVVVSTIAGTGGVGKTALAIHWCHRVLDRFPDGQLYVNLRGYDLGEPVPAAAALEGFLRALGADPATIPADLDERSAAYRSALAGRRMLVVLDNARTVEQVRPLLPGMSGCAVVVTSRDELAGLVARDGAYRLVLERMSDVDAAELLRRILGPARTESAPEASAELVRLCAGLPLALRIAAERAARRPAAPLSDLVADLADRARRLDLLATADDPYSAIRTVLSWSYDGLPRDASRLLRLLGVHPGPDVDRYAAAHLAAVDLIEAERLLDVLQRAHLIEPAAPGRHKMHDLLRVYAAELAGAEDSPSDRTAALTRLLDHYLRTSAAAMDVIAPYERQSRPALAEPAVPTPPLTDEAQALAWLDGERDNLVVTAGHAVHHGWPDHASQLAATLWRYLHNGAHHADALTLHSHALSAAEKSGDLGGRTQALTNLGTGYQRLGRYDESRDCLQRAIVLARENARPGSESSARNSLGIVYWRLGQYEEALDQYRSALALSRMTDNRAADAALLNNLGAICELLGRYDDALGYLREALALARELGDRTSEAHTLGNLGDVYQALRRYEEAIDHQQRCIALARELHDRGIETEALNAVGKSLRLAGASARAVDHHRRALALAREVNQRHQQADAHTGIGHALWAAGSVRQAREHWQEALALYTELGVPDAAEVRACLDHDGQRGF